MIRQLATLLALPGLVAASPVTAAPLGEGAIDQRIGAAAVLRMRIPLGRATTDHGRLGLAMNLQHRMVTADHELRRVDAEGVELAFGRAGLALRLAGADIAPLDQRLGAGSADERKSPWGTIALVVGGAALLSGAYLLHVIHQSEKNSD